MIASIIGEFKCYKAYFYEISDSDKIFDAPNGLIKIDINKSVTYYEAGSIADWPLLEAVQFISYSKGIDNILTGRHIATVIDNYNNVWILGLDTISPLNNTEKYFQLSLSIPISKISLGEYHLLFLSRFKSKIK